MSRNLMFLLPTILVLALTMSGTALAGSISPADSSDNALYGQPDPFAAVQTPAGETWSAFANDQRVQEELQRASTARSPGFDRGQSAPAAGNERNYEDLYKPE
jgi:hypothetical protein